MKDETMGNQQITPQYIAGIWDGEGTISITTTHVKKWKQFRSWVSVSNTDFRIIRAVELYAKSLGCGVHIGETQKPDRPRCKLQYHLKLTTLQSKLVFLESIQPYLISKKNQADIVIDFVKRRIKKNNLDGRRNRFGQYIGRESFDDYEAILHQKVKRMNLRGIPETTGHPSQSEDDIVRSLSRDKEQDRNVLARQKNLFN